MKNVFHSFNLKKLTKYIIIIIVIVVIGFIVYHKFLVHKSTQSSAKASYTTQKVETRTIQNVLSGSGTIQPLNTYDVTTLVEGKVISADFKEGDTVEKGQVLYKISTDDVDNKIESAQTKVERDKENITKAKKSYTEAVSKYNQAVADYNKAKKKYGDPDVTSTQTGIIKTLFVKEGDTIQNGAQIAEIYDNSYMLLTVPFTASDVSKSLIGKTAKVTISGSSKTLSGSVTKVNLIKEVISGNKVVRMVTVKVKNPGNISTSSTALATIGSKSSAADGNFSVLTDTIIKSEVSGTIDTLKVEEGDSIKKGSVIFTLAQDSVSSQLQSYSNAVDQAQNSVYSANNNIENAKQLLEDDESSLSDTIDSKTNYSITAPISGKIVSKNALAGDTVKNQSSTTLCTIYDLSAVTFSMNVDELDIRKVKEGDEVSITADALDGVEISGKVTNISLVSNASSGVTQYPVTIEIDEVGDLLPGMNVTGNIILEEAENCLAIPSDALQRGNMVYVRDDTVKEAQGRIPAGFKAVTVEIGITDGNYTQVISGLDGSEEVYVSRPVSTVSNSDDKSMLDEMWFNNNPRDKMQGNRNFGGNGIPGGGMPGGGMPGGGMPGGGN